MYQYDLEDFRADVRSAEEAYRIVTGDYSISMGVNGGIIEDAEIWLDHDAHEGTLWFVSLDEVDEYVRGAYPDTEWD